MSVEPDLVIRPERGNAWTTEQVFALAGGVVAVVAFALAADDAARVPILAGGAVAIVLGLAANIAFRRRGRIELSDGQVHFRGRLLRKTFPVAPPGRIVSFVLLQPAGQPSQPLQYWFGGDGERVLVLNEQVWDTDRIDDLRRAIGWSVERLDAPVTSAELRERYPVAVSWAAAHPWSMGAILAVVVGALFALIDLL